MKPLKPFDLYINPTPEQLERLFASSEHNAAKWIRGHGLMVFFRPEDAQHAEMARMLRFDAYEKGLAIPNESSASN